MKDPIKAIESLSRIDIGLAGKLNRMMTQLHAEIAEVDERWAMLGQQGGQRDDHAALLVGTLRPHLDEISRFCATCSQQITAMVADPFQRKAEQPVSA